MLEGRRLVVDAIDTDPLGGNRLGAMVGSTLAFRTHYRLCIGMVCWINIPRKIYTQNMSTENYGTSRSAASDSEANDGERRPFHKFNCRRMRRYGSRRRAREFGRKEWLGPTPAT
jgi:hypothetical protein